MAIFNSYVKLPEGIYGDSHEFFGKSNENDREIPHGNLREIQ